MDSSANNSDLNRQLQTLLADLDTHPHGEIITRALQVLFRIADTDTERLNWKILTAIFRGFGTGF